MISYAISYIFDLRLAYVVTFTSFLLFRESPLVAGVLEVSLGRRERPGQVPGKIPTPHTFEIIFTF